MQVKAKWNALCFAMLALLAPSATFADEQVDIDLLEFLGGEEIEVDGEVVTPLTLDIEEDDDATIQTTVRQTS